VAAVATDSKRWNPWVILLVVSLGFFMTLLDLTIVNIAIPNMITKLHASLDDILWVINGYALVLAVLLITCGRLGDLFGQRKLFFAGIALFTLASAACGLSTSPGYLIGFRAVQGLGAAMLMPQTLAILTMVFPPERRGAAFGVWGAVAGIATIAGPTLGGLLVTAFDWRYIFFVNVPIGAVVLVLTPILIPDLRTGRRHSFDMRSATRWSRGRSTAGARSPRSSPSPCCSESASCCSDCSCSSRRGARTESRSCRSPCSGTGITR
jgi:EmrB/QacA subfamily drug resistance transporter